MSIIVPLRNYTYSAIAVLASEKMQGLYV